MPSMPGMRMSQITAPAKSAVTALAASSALANVSVSKPDKASHWPID